MRHLQPVFGILVAATALAFVALGGSHAVTAVPGLVPRFEDSACPMELPAGQLEENVRCGYLTVEETRGSDDGRTVRLAVAILKSTSERPEPDPVVYLTGGPGGPALDGELQGLGQAEFAAFIQSERDFIFFDQRGTGLSEPGLYCPETENLTPEDLALDRTRAEARANANAKLLACRDRWVAEGVNLDSYSSVATAHDIVDLMRALGYGDYNLYGTSYGPRAILAAMRETPQRIRSVILDSPLALQANGGVDQARDLQRSLRETFDACAADPKCHAAYPNFEQQYWEVIKRANDNPIDVEIRDADGNPLTISITGDTLLSGTFVALYSTSVIRVLPFATDAIWNGNNGIVALLAQELVFAFSGFAEVMGTSVQCNEDIPFYTAELMRDGNKSVRQEIIDSEVGTSTQSALDDALALCRAWGTPKPRPKENQAVVSSIPALVLSGQFDPITPPSYGALAAEKLSRSFRFEFRSAGHGVTYEQYDCASGMIKQFLARPTTRPDSGCLATIKPLDWVIGDPPTPPEPTVGWTDPDIAPSRAATGITAPDTGSGGVPPAEGIGAGWMVGLLGAGVLFVLVGGATRTSRGASQQAPGAGAMPQPSPPLGAHQGEEARR